MEGGYLWIHIFLTVQAIYILSFYFNHSFSMFDDLMYLLLCISVNVRMVYREKAWLLSQALSLYIERAWFLRSDMVFVQRKDMALKLRHGLCTEKGHGL